MKPNLFTQPSPGKAKPVAGGFFAWLTSLRRRVAGLPVALTGFVFALVTTVVVVLALVLLGGTDSQAAPGGGEAPLAGSDAPNNDAGYLAPTAAQPVEWKPPAWSFESRNNATSGPAQSLVAAAAREAEAAGASVGVLLLDAGGNVLAAHHAEHARIPASNAKLLTSAAALATLGPEFTFTTRIVADGTFEQCESGHRRLLGDLVVLADGDPSISRRFEDDGDPLGSFRRWASGLAEHLELREISGRLICDPSIFDRERFHPTWPEEQSLRWYVAPVAGLTLQEACFELLVEVGASGEASIRTNPQTSALELAGSVSVVSGRGNPLIHLEALDDDPAEIKAGISRRLRVSGRIPRQAGRYRTDVTVRDPAQYFATVLHEAFTQTGIKIHDGVHVTRDPLKINAAAPVLVRHQTPLAEVVGVCNRHSQNLYAEHLLKRLGHAATGKPGSWDNGSAAVKEWANAWGLPVEGLQVADGSGMSRDNTVSAATLAALLQAMNLAHTSDDPRANLMAHHFHDSLAVAGQRGTLTRRLPALSGRVWAKTGTLRGVISLAGYVRHGDDPKQWYPFVILTEGFPNNAAARQWIDRLLLSLARTFE